MKYCSVLSAFFWLVVSVQAAAFSAASNGSVAEQLKKKIAALSMISSGLFYTELDRSSVRQLEAICRAERQKAIQRISRDFSASLLLAERFFGDFSLQRIELVHGLINFPSMRLFTLSEAAVYLSPDVADSVAMQELLKKVVLRKACRIAGPGIESVMRKLLGDFSDERIKHLNKLFFGEWNSCPASADDVKLHLSQEFIDEEVESFIKMFVKAKASAFLDNHNEELVNLAFDNFSHERIAYVREMLLTRWFDSTPTMAELNHLLPEDSVVRLREVFENLRLKIYVTHRNIRRVTHIHEIPAERLRFAMLDVIARAPLRKLVEEGLGSSRGDDSSSRVKPTADQISAEIESLRTETNASN